ncbi:MAG: hypothetical protein FJ100_18105 [Deltaproteobacteria bacterium]|nr:hypothetical protein [Deltaproteobacteria bacterium]
MHSNYRVRAAAAVAIGTLWTVAACGGPGTATPVASADGVVTDTPASDALAEAAASQDGAADAQTPLLAFPAQPCDGLIETACAMPWPSNLYLQPDAARKTGYTLRFGATTLPKNIADDQVGPDDYALLDGYSVGTALLVHWPHLDVTNLPNEASISLSLAADAAILWVQVDASGKVVRKVPWFAELDATEADAAKKTLIVRPAIILDPAARYVVAMRNLKDTAGKAITPSGAFTKLVAGQTAGTPDATRQPRFDDLFAILAAAGWDKHKLVVAWDFVTNSGEALHGRMLKMRDASYPQLDADKAPLKILKVTTYSEAENAHVAAHLDGEFTVPQWLAAGPDGSQTLVLGKDRLPIQQGTVKRPFAVRIPRSALKGEPHGLVQYGHGLNGHYSEVNAGYNGVIANTHKLIFYSCYWTGMSEPDIGSILTTIGKMSGFRVMPDKLHQGMLEALMLQRAMRDHFAQLPEVKQLGVVVQKGEMFYSGISQGGIYGGTVLALSKDVVRGHLGVPGNNYSTLLLRSVDFEAFFALLRGLYPESVDQQVLLMTVQLLWDAVDPVTWYRHIELEPLPGNDKHQVLIVPAKGDWQVAVLTNEIAARSGLGLKLMAHYGKPVFDVQETAYPYSGSGIVLYDHGNPWPPPGNLPPHDKLGDPHGKPRKLAHHQAQMVEFFRTGKIVDVCGGDGCTPD